MNDDHFSHRPPATPGSATSGTRCIAWRPMRSPPVLGFCKLQYASGITLAEICVMRNESGNLYCGAPTRPMLKNGVPVRDSLSGKIRYAVLIDFPNREIRNQWSNSVVAALREAYTDFDSETTEVFNDE